MSKVFIFDFDGTLCHDRFYMKTLVPQYSEIYEWIQENIFGNKELVRDWMRNTITSEEVNKMIADTTKINYQILNELFIESVQQMKMDFGMMSEAAKLKRDGAKIAIVTNNMDVFSDIIVKKNNLDKTFDIIVNSADYGLLKNDENGKLFDVALNKLEENIKNCTLIDDSSFSLNLFKLKGGEGLLYKGQTTLDLE